MHSAKERAKKLSKPRLAQILADTAAQNEALSQRLKLELMGDQTAPPTESD